jgi:hypothetical protein
MSRATGWPRRVMNLVAFLDRLDMLGEVMVGLARADGVAHGYLLYHICHPM